MQYIPQVIGNVIYKLHETYPDYREVFNFVSLLVKTEIFYNTNLKQCISSENLNRIKINLNFTTFDMQFTLQYASL